MRTALQYIRRTFGTDVSIGLITDHQAIREDGCGGTYAKMANQSNIRSRIEPRFVRFEKWGINSIVQRADGRVHRQV